MTPWWRRPKVDPDAAREAVEACEAQIEDARVALSMAAGFLVLMAAPPPRPCDPVAERAVLGWMLSGLCSASDFGELRPGYDFTCYGRRWLASVAMELLALADPRAPTERSVLFVAIDHMPERRRAVAEAELWLLPYTAARPTRELDLVVALARGWSVVEGAYGGAA